MDGWMNEKGHRQRADSGEVGLRTLGLASLGFGGGRRVRINGLMDGWMNEKGHRQRADSGEVGLRTLGLASLGFGGGRFMLSGGDWQFTAHINRRRGGGKVSMNFEKKV
jgi:hypothetical protein